MPPSEVLSNWRGSVQKCKNCIMAKTRSKTGKSQYDVKDKTGLCSRPITQVFTRAVSKCFNQLKKWYVWFGKSYQVLTRSNYLCARFNNICNILFQTFYHRQKLCPGLENSVLVMNKNPVLGLAWRTPIWVRYQKSIFWISIYRIWLIFHFAFYRIWSFQVQKCLPWPRLD